MGNITVTGSTVRCTLNSGVVLRGTMKDDKGTIILSWDNDSSWERFSGVVSGLWEGWFDPTHPLSPVYVMASNGTQLTVKCYRDDCGWLSGVGTITANHADILLDGHTRLTGTVSQNQSLISWTSPHGFWGRRPSQDLPRAMKRVHVLFMNHLDVGYNGIPIIGFINNILNIYFHEYFPRAIKVANDMRAKGGKDRFIYTTHAWLVSLYLNCPSHFVLGGGVQLQCPSSSDVEAFRQSVDRGDIVWHAGPFNLQPENMDASLFEGSLQIPKAMSELFHKNHSVTLSQRDVPFMTRSVIPILVKNGIKAISVGTNGACYPPQVPKVFWWKDTHTNTKILALEHPFGYGGITRKDCAETDIGVALCYAFRSDNAGPPLSTTEVEKNLNQIRSEFPDATVFASTFDGFVEEVLATPGGAAEAKTLTSEIGDTWLYGVPSDPLKVQHQRAMQRARRECIAEGGCDPKDPAITNFTRLLIKLPEHTWGLPGIGPGWGGSDPAHWPNEKFQAVRNTKNYVNCDTAWAEQRELGTYALQALDVAKHPLANRVRKELAEIKPSIPNLSGFTPVTPGSKISIPGLATLEIDSHGALVSLLDAGTGVEWASLDHPLARLVYHTLNDTEFSAFCKAYMNSHLMEAGFAKPGSNKYTQSAFYQPTVDRLLQHGTTVIAVMRFDNHTVATFGAPSVVYTNFTARHVGSDLQLSIEVQWFNKTATRLPESFMLEFAPSLVGKWTMDKLGVPVDPTDVLTGGCQYQHGVTDEGVTFTTTDNHKTMQVKSLDVSVVSPMTASFPHANPLPYPETPIKSPIGMAYNLFNNLWNTNYVLYYPYKLGVGDENSKFRFSLEL